MLCRSTYNLAKLVICVVLIGGLILETSNNTLAATTSVKKPSVSEKNYNLGVIEVRAIVANPAETGNKYGSMGKKFTKAKLAEVDQSLKRLNAFVKNSSFGKTKLKWSISGVHELGKGVCDHPTYGERVSDLRQRALEKEDARKPLTDYSTYLIVHPSPDCKGDGMWTSEGSANFLPYSLNGRTVHLRGMHVSDLSDGILFHEFGHHLAYKPNTGIGHPGYLNCPITQHNNEVRIELSDSCSTLYDWMQGIIPLYTIMSGKPGNLSDYNAIEKELIGWLKKPEIVTTSSGLYTLTPLEQTVPGTRVLKIPVKGTNYTAYVSFRQVKGYKYPSAPTEKPNGVIIELRNNLTKTESFLVTDSTNKDSSLKIGVPYRIGSGGPFIRVNNISGTIASVSVSQLALAKTDSPTLSADSSCVLTTNKDSYRLGERIVYSWTSKNATYANWKQDTSGKDHLELPGDKLSTRGTQSVIATVTGNPMVTLLVNNGAGSCSKVVNITN